MPPFSGCSAEVVPGFVTSCIGCSNALEPLATTHGKQQETPGRYVGVLFLDWDDTICPTTELMPNTDDGCSTPFESLPPALCDELKKIDTAAVQIITNAREAGLFVCIVTSADPRWVYLSSRTYLPHVYALLDAKKLPLFSVHGLPLGKKNVFSTEVECATRKRDQEKDFTILSFGDNETDRDHFLTGCQESRLATLKSIKFISFPSAARVRGQLEFLKIKLLWLINLKENLDLMLVVRVCP